MPSLKPVLDVTATNVVESPGQSPDLAAYHKRQREISAGKHPEVLERYRKIYDNEKLTKEAQYQVLVAKKPREAK